MPRAYGPRNDGHPASLRAQRSNPPDHEQASTPESPRPAALAMTPIPVIASTAKQSTRPRTSLKPWIATAYGLAMTATPASLRAQRSNPPATNKPQPLDRHSLRPRDDGHPRVIASAAKQSTRSRTSLKPWIATAFGLAMTATPASLRAQRSNPPDHEQAPTPGSPQPSALAMTATPASLRAQRSNPHGHETSLKPWITTAFGLAMTAIPASLRAQRSNPAFASYFFPALRSRSRRCASFSPILPSSPRGVGSYQPGSGMPSGK